MAKRRNPLVQWAITSACIAAVRLTAILPLPLCRSLGRRLGRLAYHFVPRIQETGHANLDLAYGECLTKSQKRQILIQASENLGIVAAEFSRLPGLLKPAGRKLFTVQGLEHVDVSRGGLLIGAHLGNWEWMSAVVESLGLHFTGIVRRFDDPRLDAVIDGIRRSVGMMTIPKDEAGPELVRTLKDGGFVGILIDQSPRENGVPVHFFGKPCWATVAPAMAALRAKAPIYPVAITRTDAGPYALEFSPPIEITRSGNLRQDLVDATQRCQDAIETQIRKHPGQWLWMHRRWKERPRLEREWHERLSKD